MTRDAIVTCFLPTTVEINLEPIPVVWHIELMPIEPVETNPCRIIIIKNIKLHVGGSQERSYVAAKSVLGSCQAIASGFES